MPNTIFSAPTRTPQTRRLNVSAEIKQKLLKQVRMCIIARSLLKALEVEKQCILLENIYQNPAAISQAVRDMIRITNAVAPKAADYMVSCEFKRTLDIMRNP